MKIEEFEKKVKEEKKMGVDDHAANVFGGLWKPLLRENERVLDVVATGCYFSFRIRRAI
ncbi:hypothetical protein GCM10009865_54910 [Aeromicrobium ponti]|uniref:Uncharacterized protein n=1 Tax=Cytobacillus oceanisediminis TaxID=665099 RepID=A0A562J1E2_9BACI|nr:hypothetical protein IQ19_05639 [Cytobacillus oceanisediminis]